MCRQVSLQVQVFRVVCIELTTTLAGRHTAVHGCSSQYTSYMLRMYWEY